MSRAKLSRERKRQLGQFLTPPVVAKAIIRQLRVSPDECVLEPSLGTGAFIFALLDALGEHLTPERLILWAQDNLYGCEIDERAMDDFAAEWNARELGGVPDNVVRDDFFSLASAKLR